MPASSIRRRMDTSQARRAVVDFRSLRPSGNDEVTPEWAIEHLAQHEAEHRGQIWEVRVEADTALGTSPDEG